MGHGAEFQQGMQAALEFESMNGIIMYLSNSDDRRHLELRQSVN